MARELIRRLFAWERDRKPLPLTTVELQKSGSRLLGLAPKKVLDVSIQPTCLVYQTLTDLDWVIARRKAVPARILKLS
jgi:hypothetical protein